MRVIAALFRDYRPIVGWFAVILVAAELIVVSLVSLAGPIKPSLWLVLAGSASKYWLLVAAIMLVALQLRQFAAHGVTRHEFVAAGAVFGLAAAAAFAVAVPAGHALESWLLGVLDHRAAGYPVFALADIPAEMGRTFPVSLAYFVSGALVAAGFYRYPAWIGVALLVPGAVPLVVADRSLVLDDNGPVAGWLPYAPGLALSVAATAAVGVLLVRLMRDIPIRRAAG